MTEKKLYRVKEFAFKHMWTNQNNMYNYIYKSKENGLDAVGAIVRDGKSVYIDEYKFIIWVLTCTDNLKKMYLNSIEKNKKE